MDKSGYSCRRAFTLIELLVVVVTVSILVAILLPALSAARATAKRATCLANLQQIGRAIHTYAGEYNSAIPFGPVAPPITTVTDFYPCTGSPTSLISLSDGSPVGLGLLLSRHLSSQPKVLFCPGADQRVDTDAQLALVGFQQAQCSYYYRHGSIPDSVPSAANAVPPIHIRLDNLGLNRNDRPIQALALDTEFLCDSSLSLYGVFPRTHHNIKYVNVLFSDGHAVTESNANGQFTVNLNGPIALLTSFSIILNTLEVADDLP